MSDGPPGLAVLTPENGHRTLDRRRRSAVLDQQERGVASTRRGDPDVRPALESSPLLVFHPLVVAAVGAAAGSLVRRLAGPAGVVGG